MARASNLKRPIVYLAGGEKGKQEKEVRGAAEGQEQVNWGNKTIVGMGEKRKLRAADGQSICEQMGNLLNG